MDARRTVRRCSARRRSDPGSGQSVGPSGSAGPESSSNKLVDGAAHSRFLSRAGGMSPSGGAIRAAGSRRSAAGRARRGRGTSRALTVPTGLSVSRAISSTLRSAMWNSTRALRWASGRVAKGPYQVDGVCGRSGDRRRFAVAPPGLGSVGRLAPAVDRQPEGDGTDPGLGRVVPRDLRPPLPGPHVCLGQAVLRVAAVSGERVELTEQPVSAGPVERVEIGCVRVRWGRGRALAHRTSCAVPRSTDPRPAPAVARVHHNFTPRVSSFRRLHAGQANASPRASTRPSSTRPAE